jgi:hypothetical protein
VSSIEKFQAANTNMWDGSTMAPPRLDPICLPELTTELFSLHLVVPEVVSFCTRPKKNQHKKCKSKMSASCVACERSGKTEDKTRLESRTHFKETESAIEQWKFNE